MKGKKGKGGFSSTVTNLFLSLIMIGVVLAGLQLLGITSIEDSLETAKQKASEYSECIPSGECGIATIIEDIPSIIKGEGGGKLNLPSNANTQAGNQSAGSGESTVKPSLPSDGSFKDLALDREERGYRGPAKGEPYVNEAGLVNKDSSIKMLNELKVIKDKEDDKKDVGYSRKEWKHWSSVGDRGCWNTRSEILHRDAVPGTVKYIDKKKAVSSYDTACTIGIPEDKGGKVVVETKGSGEWIDPYSGKKIKNPKDIDIDHVVPLSNAARQGGQAWSKEQKEKFANDPDNLLATSAKENRTKGDKGPGKYMPPLKSYHCQYAKTYTSVSHKYNLTITESDYEELNKALEACSM